jgi:hypothetical protein
MPVLYVRAPVAATERRQPAATGERYDQAMGTTSKAVTEIEIVTLA